MSLRRLGTPVLGLTQLASFHSSKFSLKFFIFFDILTTGVKNYGNQSIIYISYQVCQKSLLLVANLLLLGYLWAVVCKMLRKDADTNRH